MRLLLLCTLVLPLSLLCCLTFVSGDATDYIPTASFPPGTVTTSPYRPGPSVAWRPVTPTVDGFFMDETHPGPAARCDSQLVHIPTSLAKLIRPDITNDDPVDPVVIDDGTYSYALLFGGYGGEGVTYDDTWLLEVHSTSYEDTANWLSVTTPPNATTLTPRSGFSLEYLPSAQRLVAFGGRDGSTYYNDAWEYEFETGNWNAIDMTAAGAPSGFPAAREGNGGWIRINKESDNIERLILFAGVTDAKSPTALNDLWYFERNSTGSYSWQKPENLTCLNSVQYCPDALAFQDLFPDLMNDTTSILNYAASITSPLRPDDVAPELDTLYTVTTDLYTQLAQKFYTNWANDHSTTDGACSSECRQDDVSHISNRPSARQGHRISLWQGKHPVTGEEMNQLILWGGNSCVNGESNPSCFDPDLYFLDLNTFTWSVIRRPPQPPLTTKDVWPLRRAFHMQHLYLTDTVAQLWVFGGTFIDLAKTLTFKNDVAVFDLITQQWFVSDSDVTNPARIDEFGNYYVPHATTSRVASFLTSNQIWMFGGCSADESGGNQLIPTTEDNNPGTVWVMKLGQFLTPENCRVANDAAEWLFGQGVTKAIPGQNNYFFIEAAQNVGYTNIWNINTTIGQINAQLPGIPVSNATAIPFWGPNQAWGSGLRKRMQVQLVSIQVDSNQPLLVVRANISETLVDGIYVINYVITAGSQFEVYVWFDGMNVPGSPFHLKLETAQVKPTFTRPTDLSQTIPAIRYTPWGTVWNQHYGNMNIARPLAGSGLGLVKGLRKRSADFMLQIVDIYENDWIDNSNALIYLNDSVTSGVPFDAINLTMSLYDGNSNYVRDMNLATEFNYYNNEDGTYTVTYLVPDVNQYSLKIYINGESIYSDALFPIDGVELLELDTVQMAGMLSINVIVAVVMLVTFLIFLARHSSAIIRSRSLLFDSLFVIGTIFGMLTVLEQAPDYNHGVKMLSDWNYTNGTHNSCQLYNVFLGCCMILCFGSLYGMVRRAYLVAKRIRQSAGIPQGKRGYINLAHEMGHTGTGPVPLPIIPNFPSDFRIGLPIFIGLLLELIFETIWIGQAPLSPAVKIANDGFRSYPICDGKSKREWVYISIGVKGLICCFYLYFISNGRRIPDPIAEAKMLTYVGYNMAFSAVVATVLVFFLDSQDSIKTSFVVSTFAIFWSCLLFLCLIFLPRLRQILRGKADEDPYWYDNFIIQLQDEEISARARAEKEYRDGKSQLSGLGSQSSGSGGSTLSNMSSMGASTLGTIGTARNAPTAAGGGAAAAAAAAREGGTTNAPIVGGATASGNLKAMAAAKKANPNASSLGTTTVKKPIAAISSMGPRVTPSVSTVQEAPSSLSTNMTISHAEQLAAEPNQTRWRGDSTMPPIAMSE